MEKGNAEDIIPSRKRQNEHIRELLKKTGKTFADLGRYLFVSRSAISHKLSDKYCRCFSMEDLQRLADYFGVSFYEIYLGRELTEEDLYHVRELLREEKHPVPEVKNLNGIAKTLNMLNDHIVVDTLEVELLEAVRESENEIQWTVDDFCSQDEELLVDGTYRVYYWTPDGPYYEDETDIASGIRTNHHKFTIVDLKSITLDSQECILEADVRDDFDYTRYYVYDEDSFDETPPDDPHKRIDSIILNMKFRAKINGNSLEFLLMDHEVDDYSYWYFYWDKAS